MLWCLQFPALAPCCHIPLGSINKRAAHEAALRKWVEALDQVNTTLKGLGRNGHTATLRHQVRGPGAVEDGAGGVGTMQQWV